jgi:hypothetical protein
MRFFEVGQKPNNQSARRPPDRAKDPSVFPAEFTGPHGAFGGHEHPDLPWALGGPDPRHDPCPFRIAVMSAHAI